jgi:hypothetical protein
MQRNVILSYYITLHTETFLQSFETDAQDFEKPNNFKKLHAFCGGYSTIDKYSMQHVKTLW